MQMSKVIKPRIIQKFENWLWAHSHTSWILKSVYFQGTLFVSMLISTDSKEPYEKIRRSFSIDTIQDRAEDLEGLASDCIDEMKREYKG